MTIRLCRYWLRATVWFTYSRDRRGEHPQGHLVEYRGILQADAFACFNELYKSGAIQEAPCLAHIRRKFYDLVEAYQAYLRYVLERIATHPINHIEELLPWNVAVNLSAVPAAA